MTRAGFLAPFMLLLTTCCPSIWLTVNKGNPDVRPWLPIPKVASPPIVKPTHVMNRFDVIDKKPTSLYPLFTDQIMRDEDFINVHTGTLDELRSMQGTKGSRNGPSLNLMPLASEAMKATLTCNAGDCKSLTIKAPIPLRTVRFARIVTETANEVRVVRSCMTGLDPNNDVDLTPCTPPQGPTFVSLSQHVPGRDKEEVTVSFSESIDLTETLLTFVHLSDVQLRDPAVTLTDPELSHRLDWLIPSFEYDHDQAFYGRYVVEALLATINAEADRFALDDPRRPAFVIHTGDSIDSGTASELLEFHGLVDELHIPFYNAIGNHDILVFGNLLPSTTRDKDDTCVDARSLAAHSVTYFRKERRILPNRLCVDDQITCSNCMAGEAQFVAKTDIERSRATFMAAFKHSSNIALPQPSQDDTWTCEAAHAQSQPLSRMHGFDLNPPHGYYAFARKIVIAGIPRHVVFVILDSEDLPPNTGGAGGHVGADQITWVKNVLNCVAGRNDLVLVFSHHSLGDLVTPKMGTCRWKEGDRMIAAQCNELEALFANDNHVVGHFYGHNHKHGLCRDGRKTACKSFWEIETGAMIEFPQEARLVRLKYAGAGLAYFDLTTFTERLEPEQNEFTYAVARGRRGAERDYCHTHRDEIKCSPDGRVQRQDGRHTNARLFFRLP